jgi:hypothetical protein
VTTAGLSIDNKQITTNIGAKRRTVVIGGILRKRRTIRRAKCRCSATCRMGSCSDQQQAGRPQRALDLRQSTHHEEHRVVALDHTAFSWAKRRFPPPFSLARGAAIRAPEIGLTWHVERAIRLRRSAYSWQHLSARLWAGKTSVGRLLAKRFGKTFYDCDQEIERRTGVKFRSSSKSKAKRFPMPEPS